MAPLKGDYLIHFLKAHLYIMKIGIMEHTSVVSVFAGCYAILLGNPGVLLNATGPLISYTITSDLS